MMGVSDLVEVVIIDSNHGKQGIVVELLSSGSVCIYIGTERFEYPTSWLRKVECSK